MADRIARVWNGSSWEVITSTAAAPTAVVNYQSASPSGPVTGQVWVDSDDDTTYVYDGSAWKEISTLDFQEDTMTIALSDEDTSITTGAAKVTFRAPFAMTLTSIPRSSLSTASTSGLVTVDINERGTSVLGANKLSIDANEKTSTTASTATTLSDTSIADDAEITFDIDAAGTGAKGLKVTLYYRRT